MEGSRESRLRGLLRRVALLESLKPSNEEVSALFIRLRSDCRDMQRFHRCRVISSLSGDVHRRRETVLSRGVDDDTAAEADLYLIHCEERLSAVKLEDCGPEEMLTLLLETQRMRDRVLYEVCTGLIRQLGVDYLHRGQAKDISPRSTPELTHLFAVLRTFMHMGAMVISVSKVIATCP